MEALEQMPHARVVVAVVHVQRIAQMLLCMKLPKVHKMLLKTLKGKIFVLWIISN